VTGWTPPRAFLARPLEVNAAARRQVQSWAGRAIALGTSRQCQGLSFWQVSQCGFAARDELAGVVTRSVQFFSVER
jgi:hypothetical protein